MKGEVTAHATPMAHFLALVSYSKTAMCETMTHLPPRSAPRTAES
jgi:hypothetical protein